MRQIQLDQRIELHRLSPTKWRLVGLVGKAIFFYGEAGSEELSFSVANEFSAEDVGRWRAVGDRRRLIVGHSGRATVTPKPDGKEGEVSINFTGVALEI